MTTTAATEIETAAIEAALTELSAECASQVCHEVATHALVFAVGCDCTERRASWLLCSPHIDRGLQELRDREAWRCDECGASWFRCEPVGVVEL